MIAFGDSDNDLPMLRWAGRSFAMGNARPDVIRAVGRTTGESREGGVGQAVERYLDLD